MTESNECVVEGVTGLPLAPAPTRIKDIDENDQNEECKEVDRAVSQVLGVSDADGRQADD